MIDHERDEEISIARIRTHFPKASVPPIRIYADERRAARILRRVLPYLPFRELVCSSLEVHARIAFHEEHPEWLGCQVGDRIDLFLPAHRSVTTLLYTFFHEFGHWIYENRTHCEDDQWRSFFQMPLHQWQSESENPLAENIADTIAWFCMHPHYLQIVDKPSYEKLCRLQSDEVTL